MHPIGTMIETRRPSDLQLYFCGQGLSNVGTWIQQAGLAWLVLQLARAANPASIQAAGFDLGLVALAGQAPSLVLTPPAGVWADRWDRRRLIRLTQAAAALQALALAALVWSQAATIGGLVLLSLLLGSINAVAAPAMQGFVADLVNDRRALPHAVAVSSSLSTGARLLGPAIGAGLLWAGGPAVCFLVNALSYLPLLIMLPRLHVRSAQSPPASHAGWFADWRAAITYLVARPELRTVLGAVAGACFFGMSFYVLLPLLAAQVLGGDEGTYGLLLAGVGLGGGAAAIVLITRSRPRELARRLAGAQAALVVALGGIALTSATRPMLAWLALAGFALVLQLGAGNVLLHALVDDDKRGRVTSFFLLAFTGLTPLGGWLAGTIAGRYGLAPALWAGAAGMAACALWYLRRMNTRLKHKAPTAGCAPM
jgi:MFS family permease